MEFLDKLQLLESRPQYKKLPIEGLPILQDSIFV